MRKGAVWSLLLVILSVTTAPASEINTAGKLFLIEPGARSVGIGGAGTLLGESTTGLYNPAAQVLCPDLSGSVFTNPHPYFTGTYGYLAISVVGHTEFGYIGFSYLTRDGVDGTSLPPEEASALMLAGRPSRKLNLAVGFAFKILATQKANFAALNQSLSKAYKMAFDFGLVYHNLLPKLTFGKAKFRNFDLRKKYALPFSRGISFGATFQNLGGAVDFEEAIDIEMLPQLFRGDLLWGIYENRYWDLRAAGQIQKLLVERSEAGGYKDATYAFFHAWGGGELEGTWTSRLGFELGLLGLLSGRVGWSVEHKDHRSFTYYGLGLGPEWLRINIARQYEPGQDYDLGDELRFDVAVNLGYDQLRGWTSR
jgi:hypothetical protein